MLCRLPSFSHSDNFANELPINTMPTRHSGPVYKDFYGNSSDKLSYLLSGVYNLKHINRLAAMSHNFTAARDRCNHNFANNSFFCRSFRSRNYLPACFIFKNLNPLSIVITCILNSFFF